MSKLHQYKCQNYTYDLFMKAKFTDEEKEFVLRMKKLWPSTFQYMGRKAKEGYLLEDILLSLRQLELNKYWLDEPWPYLVTYLNDLKRKRERDKDDKRVEEWEGVKIQSEEDLKNWLRGVK